MENIHDKNTWPIWATETIDIVEPNPRWIKKGEHEKALLLDILSSSGITEIQHYGSTSIPNLPSKPIIDLMAKIDSFETVEDIASLLIDYNWHYVHPDLDQRPWQRFFVKVTNDKREVHLHLLLEGDERWDKQLLFRDRLQSNRHLVNEYAMLKKNLVKKYSNDRELYTNAKTEFINSVLKLYL
ncbi:MAG: GrpB family protein [Bacillota bacterium]